MTKQSDMTLLNQEFAVLQLFVVVYVPVFSLSFDVSFDIFFFFLILVLWRVCADYIITLQTDVVLIKSLSAY